MIISLNNAVNTTAFYDQVYSIFSLSNKPPYIATSLKIGINKMDILDDDILDDSSRPRIADPSKQAD